MARDVTTSSSRSPRIPKTIIKADLSVWWSKMSPSTLKRMIATASLTMPSPNTIAKSLGYLLGLIIVRAATESEAQIVALYLMIREVLRTTLVLILLHSRIQSKL